MARFLCYMAWLWLLLSNGQAQIDEDIPQLQPYDPITTQVLNEDPSTGNFTKPTTSGTQVFDEGATMRIEWISTYSAIKLYVLFNQSYVNQTQLASV